MQDILKTNEQEAVLHGACLGIGLMSLGTKDSGVLATLKEILFKDKAISGEAASIGIGLLMMGTCDLDLITELANFARENKHDKISRAIAVAISLILVNSEN